MKILKIDEKKKTIALVPEILDDLWHLQQVIEKGDLVSGSTDRKIKGEEGKETLRVKMFLELNVENAEFDKYAGTLRVSGIIVRGSPAEYVEEKAHHSLGIELGEKLEIVKEKMKKYQIERLEKAQKATHKEKVLVISLDDEDATFFILKEFGIEKKCVIKSGKSGKGFAEEEWRGKYFSEIAKKIEEIGAKRIVIAGPGFTRQEFGDYLGEKGLKKEMEIFTEATGSAGGTGLNELMKTDKLQKITEKMLVVMENQLIEKIMREFGQGSGLVEYGIKEVEKAIGYGAVEDLVILDETLMQDREGIEKLMIKCEENKGKVHLISRGHEAGKQLEGFGGIVALLRYRIK